MKNIEVFKNVSEITDKYDLGRHRFIDSGSEGRAFRIGNEIVKMYDKIPEISYQDVITIDDFNLKSFLFPKKLLLVDDKLVGYTTDYFPNDILTLVDDNPDNIYEIDLDSLRRSREVFLKDLEVLTDAGIYTVDMPFNLLYDGKVLKAIDTAKYKELFSASENKYSLDVGIRRYLKEFNLKYKTGSDYYIEDLKRRYGPKIYSK